MGPANSPAIDLGSVAHALKLSLPQVSTVAALLDEGNTVPFITRYRKDQTGGLDEEQIRQIQTRLAKLRLLAERKQTILRSIESQGKLTPELAAQIEAADGTKQLEDLYLPFKPKKQTLATVARERGLEPLAEEIVAAATACENLDARAADFVNTDRGITSPADALLGVGHILAERASERADLRQRLRKIVNRSGRLASSRAEGSDEKQAQGFRDYFEFSEPLERVPPHRVLAINRGEKAKLLRVKIEADLEAMQQTADELLVPAEHPHAEFLRGCGRDALARLVIPSLEREVRRELTDWAEAHAVQVFARNLRNLLLQPPVRGRRRAGRRSRLQERLQARGARRIRQPARSGRDSPGGQAAAPRRRQKEARRSDQAASAHAGGHRQRHRLPRERRADERVAEPASCKIKAWPTSSSTRPAPAFIRPARWAAKSFPNTTPRCAGAISIGRRIQDPLSELVKIDPASIGVGLYQHDVKAKHLRDVAGCRGRIVRQLCRRRSEHGQPGACCGTCRA